jgi:hypothetical protein
VDRKAGWLLTGKGFFFFLQVMGRGIKCSKIDYNEVCTIGEYVKIHWIVYFK